MRLRKGQCNYPWGVYYLHEGFWTRMSGHLYKRTAEAQAAKMMRLNPGKVCRASKKRPEAQAPS